MTAAAAADPLSYPDDFAGSHFHYFAAAGALPHSDILRRIRFPCSSNFLLILGFRYPEYPSITFDFFFPRYVSGRKRFFISSPDSHMRSNRKGGRKVIDLAPSFSPSSPRLFPCSDGKQINDLRSKPEKRRNFFAPPLFIWEEHLSFGKSKINASSLPFGSHQKERRRRGIPRPRSRSIGACCHGAKKEEDSVFFFFLARSIREREGGGQKGR